MDKILISVSSFGEHNRDGLEIINSAGLEMIKNPYRRRLTGDEIAVLGKDCVGLIAGLEELSEDVMKRLPNLRVISRVGAGVDNIDLEAAEKFDIIIRNTPDAPTEAVAELAVGMAFDLSRRITMMDRSMRKGKWERVSGSLVNGKTIGIIGLGRIGKRVAELFSGLSGVSIIASDIRMEGFLINGKKIDMVPLEDLLKASDIIMLHVSGKGCIIGARELGMVKRGAYIVNVSRGGVIDEDALYHALMDGRLGGAALDVFDNEPYQGKLTALDNVVLTPHIGSYTAESRLAMEVEAARNLLDGLKISRKRVG